MTGVTAGAMGFIGAAAFIAGLRRAAFLAGFFFLPAFREDFFEDFFEDLFLEAFFFATRFLDDRFLDDFFLAFLAVFFFAFFFAAMFDSFQCWTEIVVRDARLGFPRTTNLSIRTERVVSRFYAQWKEKREVKGDYLARLDGEWYRPDTNTRYSTRFFAPSGFSSAKRSLSLSRARTSRASPASIITSHGRGREL